MMPGAGRTVDPRFRVQPLGFYTFRIPGVVGDAPALGLAWSARPKLRAESLPTRFRLALPLGRRIGMLDR